MTTLRLPVGLQKYEKTVDTEAQTIAAIEGLILGQTPKLNK